MFEYRGSGGEPGYVLLADAPTDLDTDTDEGGLCAWDPCDPADLVAVLGVDLEDDLRGVDLAVSLAQASGSPSWGADQAELLAAVGGWDRVASFALAQRARAIAGFAVHRPPAPKTLDETGRGERGARPLGEGARAHVSEFAPDEVAAELAWSPTLARRVMSEALGLVEHLPATLRTVEEGRIPFAVASVIEHETSHLSPEDRTTVEAQVLNKVEGRSYAAARDRVKRAALRIDPVGTRRRRAEARTSRGTTLRMFDDDTMGLTTIGGVEETLLAFATLDAYASANIDPDEPPEAARAGQASRRTDVLFGLITALREQTLPDYLSLPPGTEQPRTPKAIPPVIRIDILTTTPALTGADEEPGHVLGIGPIPADATRTLAGDPAAQARVIRLDSTEPELCTDSYRPTRTLRETVIARDRTCRFPGCLRRVTGAPGAADLDHTTACSSDLRSLSEPTGKWAELICVVHHRLKHEAGWSLTQPARGMFEWTSPTGKTYRVHPDTWDIQTTPPPQPPPPPEPDPDDSPPF